MKRRNVLVTGGAGFIGSNIVEALLEDERIAMVRVIDNLSTGFYANLKEFEDRPDFEFVHADIRDFDVCLEVTKDIDLISHQAALGSVPRSLQDPIATNSVNIDGTLNIFYAAVQNGITRVVFAASSSTYGDERTLPKIEDKIGRPLSPYAVTKLVNELYADVFARNYPFEFIGLRYFNIFGPKQDPRGAYAAVIPLFFQSALSGNPPTINGDGTFSRDFTYIQNAVQANLLGLFTANPNAINQIYNIAFGGRTTLNELWSYITEVTSSSVEAIHGPPRKGDIPHSLADISKAKTLLGYESTISVKDGLQKTFDWFTSRKSARQPIGAETHR